MTSISPPSGVASPFENNHADPWAKTFIDLPALNSKVTDAITSAIRNVRSAARKKGSDLRTSSILVLGPAGAGKTHLFTRLRHKLGPKAVFVHLRPLVGTEMTPRYVLGQIVQQLGYETAASEGSLKQLEALVGSSLAQLEGANPEFPRMFVDELAGLEEADREQKIEEAVEKLLELHQEADETYLGRLLAAPFMKPSQQRAALAWLAGRELEESQMKRLGVTASLAEDRIIQALQTLGTFAAPGAPIVLVFDQLENLMDAESSGARIRAYANLVAELFDTMRGYVLVQMALDSEWEQAILPQLSAAQKTRLGGHAEVIALPTPSQSRELIAGWVEHLPNRAESFPWPFGEKRVAIWAETPGMTPRMLMIACRQALALGPAALSSETIVPPPTNRSSAHDLDDGSDDTALAQAWEKHLMSARATLDEAAEDRRSADAARLVGGIACALRFAKGVATTRVDARQHIQLMTRLADDSYAIALLHQTHPRAAAAALDRAADAFSKNKVVLIRERSIEFPPTWKKVQAAVVALVRKGARWITLERDDTANFIALESFLAAAKSRDLEDASGRAFDDKEVGDWLARSLRVTDWPLVATLAGAAPDEEAEQVFVEAAKPSPSKGETKAGASRASSDTATTIKMCLGQLRVASLERLVREVVRAKPDATRTDVVSALEAMPEHVRWFGRSIVAVQEGR